MGLFCGRVLSRHSLISRTAISTWVLYTEDRWSPSDLLLVQPGLRFDWDEVVRKPLFSPRVAFTYIFSKAAKTKISGGIGVYYDHTQLEYLERAFQSTRTDTYYATDGVTPTGSVIVNHFVLPASLQGVAGDELEHSIGAKAAGRDLPQV